MKRVELLCNGSPASNHLEVQLAQVLVLEGDRDILCPHVGRVPWPRNLPERQKSLGLLLLNPEDINLDMMQFRNALALDNSNATTTTTTTTTKSAKKATGFWRKRKRGGKKRQRDWSKDANITARQQAARNRSGPR